MTNENINAELYPIYHETGHWMIANGLGYEGYLTGDLKQNNNFRFYQTSTIQKSVQGLKNQILIAFGGLGAEKILKIPENAGYIGDLTIACPHLKELYLLEKKIFDFKNYLDFPDNEYDYYLTQSQLVLNQLGGKNSILKIGGDVYNQLLNPKNKP